MDEKFNFINHIRLSVGNYIRCTGIRIHVKKKVCKVDLQKFGNPGKEHRLLLQGFLVFLEHPDSLRPDAMNYNS